MLAVAPRASKRIETLEDRPDDASIVIVVVGVGIAAPAEHIERPVAGRRFDPAPATVLGIRAES